jgi:hypothetical protein
MNPTELRDPFEEVGREFDERTHRDDGHRVAAAFDSGLTLLRDLLYLRLHDDVERMLGTDSIMMPVSAPKSEVAVKHQIELYQIAESAVAVREFGCFPAAEDWFIEWLSRLRQRNLQGDLEQERIADYMAQSEDARRLGFADVVARTLPEARRAPLVLFRLVPLAVYAVTALALGDHRIASKVRDSQKHLLPAIADCHQCRGEILENGERCRECGNPLWKGEWLVMTD